VPLEVTGRSTAREGRFLVLECAARQGTQHGLYDLVVRACARGACMKKAVCVCERFRDPFTFVHTTDLHLLKPGSEGRIHDRRDMAAAMVEEINARKPEFVLNTGDAISRYGTRPDDILPPEVVVWQFQEFVRLMRRLEVPMFLVAGNHDRAFSWSRREWLKHMGRPWDRPWCDYSFEYGDYHFVTLDGSVTCDDHTGASAGNSCSSERVAWLADDLKRAAGSRLRFLFHHYDYGRKLLPAIEEGGVDMVLYGHSRRPTHEPGTATGWLASHLRGREAYRVISVEHGTISQSVPRLYEDLAEPSILGEQPWPARLAGA